MVVTNTYANDISVFLGNGDGTFQNQMIYSTGGIPGSITADDFNNDSKLDLATVSYVEGTISV